MFFYLQQIKFKSQLEQQRLQLQREHSSEMEQILEKVSHELFIFLNFFLNQGKSFPTQLVWPCYGG